MYYLFLQFIGIYEQSMYRYEIIILYIYKYRADFCRPYLFGKQKTISFPTIPIFSPPFAHPARLTTSTFATILLRQRCLLLLLLLFLLLLLTLPPRQPRPYAEKTEKGYQNSEQNRQNIFLVKSSKRAKKK